MYNISAATAIHARYITINADVIQVIGSDTARVVHEHADYFGATIFISMMGILQPSKSSTKPKHLYHSTVKYNHLTPTTFAVDDKHILRHQMHPNNDIEMICACQGETAMHQSHLWQANVHHTLTD